jgi:ABC-type branched-subunit amino acid transport system substrate-binding protein
MTRRRSAFGLLAVVALAGCGTTVSGTTAASDTTGAGGTSGNTLSVPSTGTGAGGAVGGTAGVAGSTGSGAAQAIIPGPGGSTSATGGTPGAGSSGTPGGTAAPNAAIGITPTKIYVGVTYSSGGDAANKALGNTLTQGDQQADGQAVIDDINAHGGVAGRKLVPVWYNYQTTDARPYTNIDAEACAKFTQDNQVFAVAGDGLTDNFAACVTHAGALLVSTATTIIGPDQAYFEKYPYAFSVGYLTQDRMMAEEVRSLVRQDYFSGWNTATGDPASAVPAKVGIISFDTPNWSVPLHHVMLPALARAGHPVDPTNVQEVAYPQGTNGIGATIAQIQSAVLKFRQNGVTHVVILDGNGSMTLYMLNNMRGQHYYPRLGINSATGAEVLATQYHSDAQSFNGAVGLGWGPLLDLPQGQGDKYFTPHTKACINMVEKRTGQQFADTNSASIALGYCDELYLIADAINGAGAVVNRDAAALAIEALRGTFPASGTYGVYFSPTRHDGIEYGYDLKFDISCTCTKYTRGPFHIP